MYRLEASLVFLTPVSASVGRAGVTMAYPTMSSPSRYPTRTLTTYFVKDNSCISLYRPVLCLSTVPQHVFIYVQPAANGFFVHYDGISCHWVSLSGTLSAG